MIHNTTPPPAPWQAAEMRNLLRELVEWNADLFENNEPVNGGDAVEFLDDLRTRAKLALGDA